MNLSDLSKIDFQDLKQIDLAEVREKVQKRPDILINVLLITITFFVIIFFWSKFGWESKHLKEDILKFNQKLSVLKDQERIMQEIKDFVQKFPKYISSEQLVNQITDVALHHNIQILSYTPAETTSEEHWTTTGMIFNLSATDYNDLLSFFQEIENSPYALKIENWSGESSEIAFQKGAMIENKIITAVVMKIQSIRLKNV